MLGRKSNIPRKKRRKAGQVSARNRRRANSHRFPTGNSLLQLSLPSENGGMNSSNEAQNYRRADGSKLRALVVDDEAALQELLSTALRYEGFEVQIAGDGAGALSAVRDFLPDVVILDVMLPDISGMEVLRRLRQDQLDIPVL